MYESFARNSFARNSSARNEPHGIVCGRAPRWMALVAATALLATSIAPAIARADDQDAIDYRQHVMNTMGEQMVLIDQIIQMKAPADNLATFAQILAMTATTAQGAFKPNVAGGDSKPSVWTSWPDFSKRLDALVASTADLAKAAKAGDSSALASKVAALGCMSCHDIYEQKK
ncbi:MAG TPA: cytochrome c [Steroidobacteraceae bacterium]|nr:cytochrome c [Steroidobacteraceae bacterium]